MEDILNTVDPNTGMTLLQTLMTTLVSVIGVVLMAALTWLSLRLKTVLPSWMASQIDEKNMKTLHSAAMTIVRKILLEGGDPEEELNRVLDYMKSSAKDAFIGALKTRTDNEVDRIFTDIAVSKIPLGLVEIGDAMSMIEDTEPAPEPVVKTTRRSTIR